MTFATVFQAILALPKLFGMVKEVIVWFNKQKHERQLNEALEKRAEVNNAFDELEKLKQIENPDERTRRRREELHKIISNM